MMPMTSTIPAGEDPINMQVSDPALGPEHISQSSKEVLASERLQVSSSQSCKMMPMTSNIPSGEDPINIHVHDPVLGLEHIFQCSKELITSRVGHFANQMTYDRLTIENCDLCLFDWLIRWLHGETTTFATTNVLRILLLASFLKVERLVQQSIDFCLKEKVETSCLLEADLLGLGPYLTVAHLEGLAGAGTGTSRLFYELLAGWTGDRGPDPLHGTFCDLSLVSRCLSCSALVHADRKCGGDPCPQHAPDPAWNPQGYAAQLHRETRSWRVTFWRLWGQVHYFKCSRCKLFSSAERVSSEMHYPCCGKRVFRRDFLHTVDGYPSDDVCRALYATITAYFSRVTREASAEESESHCEPIIDMSVIRRGDRRFLEVPELVGSLADDISEDGDGGRASCGDPSDDEDSAHLRRENVRLWVYGDADNSPWQTDIDQLREDEIPNRSLLGPHGDSLPAMSCQEKSDEEPSQTIVGHGPQPSKSNGGESMLKITCDNKCGIEKNGSRSSSKRTQNLTEDGKHSTEMIENNGGEQMQEIAQDDKRTAEDNGSAAASDRMPKIMHDKSADDSSSDDDVRMLKMTQDDKCTVDDGASDGSVSDDSERSPIMTREYEYGAEDDESPARSECSDDYAASNFGSDKSTASSTRMPQEEKERAKEQTTDKSTAEGEPSSGGAYNVKPRSGRRTHEEQHFWQSHLSNADNQINQHNHESNENEKIIQYLTSKVYRLATAKCNPEALPINDAEATCKWLTYTQTEDEVIGPQTPPSNTQCGEPHKLTSTHVRHVPTNESNVIRQNK